eukprot:TRINITY_DN12258_c0_g1_i1.p1 TRINITY_DN12258_c0_g1~~TRINITY_DN12258_c0_g1_i1.p1  ORF type:complete len:973 (+),score=142.86 TRINITY_DN12258_c0_g1_i1:783-3701(+)
MDFLDAGEDGRYISESSSAVLDLDKCLSILGRSGSDMMMGGSVGKAMLHHLIREPSKVAATLVPMIFDIKTRSHILEVVKFLHTAACQDSKETHGKFLSVFASILRSGENTDALFATCFIVCELASSQSALTEGQKVTQIELIIYQRDMAIDLLKMASSVGSVTKKERQRPTKLGLKAIQSVGSVLHNLPNTASVRDLEPYCDLVWSFYSHVVLLLKLHRSWFQDHRPLLGSVGRVLIKKLEDVSNLRAATMSMEHNRKRMGVPLGESEQKASENTTQALLNIFDLISYLLCPVDYSSELRKLTNNQATDPSLVIKLSILLGSLSASEQSDLFSPSNHSSAKEHVSRLVGSVLRLADSKQNGAGGDEQILMLEILQLVTKVDSQMVPQFNLGKLIELVRDGNGEENAAISSIAVKMSEGRSRTVVTELLKIPNKTSVHAITEILSSQTDQFLSQTTDVELSSMVTTILSSNSPHSLKLVSLLPPSPNLISSLLLKSFADTASAVTPRQAQEALLSLSGGEACRSVAFLKDLYQCIHEYTGHVGTAFEADKNQTGEVAAAAVPVDPSDIGNSFTKKSNQTPKYKTITELVKAIMEVWVDSGIRGVVLESDILVEVLTQFKNRCTEEFIVAATTTSVLKLLKNGDGELSPSQCAVLLDWITGSIEGLLASSPTDIFSWLVPLLVLRPLPQQFFDDSQNSSSLIPKIKKLVDCHNAKDTMRLGWEILSRCNPMSLVVGSGVSDVSDLKLRLFAICNRNASLLNVENLSPFQWGIVSESRLILTDMLLPVVREISSPPAELRAAIADCDGLTLASLIRGVDQDPDLVKKTLRNTIASNPTAVLTSLAHLKRSVPGISKQAADHLIELLVDGGIDNSRLEILFQLIYATPSDRLTNLQIASVVDVAITSLNGVMDIQLASLKLIGAILVHADQFAALRQEVVHSVVKSLSDIATTSSGPPQQLASQLLSVLMSKGMN